MAAGSGIPYLASAQRGHGSGASTTVADPPASCPRLLDTAVRLLGVADLDCAPPLEENAAMAKARTKPKQDERARKQPRKGIQDRTKKVSAAPSRYVHTRKAKKNAAQDERARDERASNKGRPARAPAHEQPPQPTVAVAQAPSLPTPAPVEPTPAEELQQRAVELLAKLAKLASNYLVAALDDMGVHRQAAHPTLLPTARILQAIVLATDLNDSDWLEARAKAAESYLAAHRSRPQPPKATNRYFQKIYTRAEAASHMKRFVLRKLQTYAEGGRRLSGVTLSNEIAEVIVGNLLGGAVDLAWEILPKLDPGTNEASVRAVAAHEIKRILEGADPKDLEPTAENIVRRVLGVLGYRESKSLFDFERKKQKRDAHVNEQPRTLLQGDTAAPAPTEMQPEADAADNVPPPQRNK
jgi:hypothetical protein